MGKLLFVPIFFGCIAYVYFHHGHLLSLETLKDNRDVIDEFVKTHPHLSCIAYITVMSSVTGLTIPGATTLSFMGGVLFEQPYAAMYAYVGYITGAAISYTSIKFFFKEAFLRRFQGSEKYTKFETNVKQNAFVYVIVARYTMIFPFFFVNAMCALVNVRFPTFITATMLAVLPGSVIYTTAGRTLGNMMERSDFKEIPKMKLVYEALFDPNVKICLGGLMFALSAALLINLYHKKAKEKRGADEDVVDVKADGVIDKKNGQEKVAQRGSAVAKKKAT